MRRNSAWSGYAVLRMIPNRCHTPVWVEFRVSGFSCLRFFCDEPDIEVHANRLGIADEGAHVHIFRSSFGATELRGTGADLLGEFGLGEPLSLPLLSKLDADREDFGLLFIGLADGWIGELLIEVAIPFGFHLRFFSFAGRPAAGLEGLLAASLASCRATSFEQVDPRQHLASNLLRYAVKPHANRKRAIFVGIKVDLPEFRRG
jgi:hypothetical protein